MLAAREATEQEEDFCGLHFSVRPPKQKRSDAPLVLLVHGRAGDSRSMWTFSSAVAALDPLVAAPQAFISDLNGFSWFEPRAKDAPSDPEAQAAEVHRACERLDEFIERIEELFSIRPPVVIGIGFSQGAGMLAALSLTRPGRFAGVAMLSGFVPSAIVPELKPAVGDTRYFIFHGTEDRILPVERARRTKELIESLGCEVELFEDKAPHKVTSKGLKELKRWCEGFSLR